MGESQTDPRAPLTATQTAILAVIRETVRDRGYPPSLREIGTAVGLASSSSIAHQLTVLQARGYIVREENRPRALRILDDPTPDPQAVLRATGRDLINASLLTAQHPDCEKCQGEQAQAWDAFALALDAAEDAAR